MPQTTNDRLILVAVALLLFGLTSVAGESVKQAKSAIADDDYETAMAILLPLAGQGDASAQYYLGSLYYFGLGVKENHRAAAHWFRTAAEQGNARAQDMLGTMYYFRIGVPQNFAEALKWFQKAADQGDDSAQHSLGRMYAEGKGVPRDAKEAAKWYRKAADRGNASAQADLGRMYADGTGVPEDLVAAHVWLNLALSASDFIVTYWEELLIMRIEAKMTAAQIAEAQKRALEWKPTKP